MRSLPRTSSFSARSLTLMPSVTVMVLVIGEEARARAAHRQNVAAGGSPSSGLLWSSRSADHRGARPGRAAGRMPVGASPGPGKMPERQGRRLDVRRSRGGLRNLDALRLEQSRDDLGLRRDHLGRRGRCRWDASDAVRPGPCTADGSRARRESAAWALEDGTSALRCCSGTGWSGVDGARASLRHDDAADGSSGLGCWCGFRNSCGCGFGCCCGLEPAARGRSPRGRLEEQVRLASLAPRQAERRRVGGLRCGRRRGCRRSSYYCGGAHERTGWTAAGAPTGGRAMTGPTGGLLAIAGA